MGWQPSKLGSPADDFFQVALAALSLARLPCDFQVALAELYAAKVAQSKAGSPMLYRGGGWPY